MVAESSGTTWDEAKWQRYGLLAGVGFVVLNLVSTFAGGTPPSRDASADKIAKYFIDNDSGIKLGTILFGFALMFGIWWLGALVMWQRFLPVWMGWLALLSALVCAVATVGVGSESAIFVGFQMIGLLSWSLWVLLASVLLYRRKVA